MKNDGVKKNLLFQFEYQIIILIIPLLISPYLTRVLGKYALGIYSYTYSIAYYFVLFGSLGIVKHGQRIIASRRDDIIKLRKTFWSLLIVHFIISLISTILYLLFCFFFCKEDRDIYLLQTLYIISNIFDITWLFYGIERIRHVVIRNAFIKIGELFLIFFLVKNKHDLSVYTSIMGGSAILSQFLLIPIAIKNIKPIKISFKDIKEHFKPLIVLSISVFAISLYTVFDKTLLGLLKTKDLVAFYEYSNKIINIPKVFITIVGTVLFPRACNCIAKNNKKSLQKYYKYSILLVYFIGFASIFGLIGIADLFSKLYFGKEFLQCGQIIKFMTPIILIVGIGDVFRMMFLIPKHKDIQYVTCIIINAIINIIISFILIPKLNVIGAVLGTLSAELMGLIIQTFLVRKDINIKKTILIMIPFIISGIIMLLSIELVKTYINITFFNLIVQSIIGTISYITILLIWFLIISKDKKEYRNISLKIIRKLKI